MWGPPHLETSPSRRRLPGINVKQRDAQEERETVVLGADHEEINPDVRAVPGPGTSEELGDANSPGGRLEEPEMLCRPKCLSQENDETHESPSTPAPPVSVAARQTGKRSTNPRLVALGLHISRPTQALEKPTTMAGRARPANFVANDH